MTEPPEWLVTSVVLCMREVYALEHYPPQRGAFAKWEIDDAVAVLAEIAKHGKLMARKPTPKMNKATNFPREPWMFYNYWDAAPQWPEEKK